MRMLLLGTASAIGIVIASAGSVSALPANGAVIRDTVNAASPLSRVYYYYTYRYRYYYTPRYRYRYYYYYNY